MKTKIHTCKIEWKSNVGTDNLTKPLSKGEKEDPYSLVS